MEARSPGADRAPEEERWQRIRRCAVLATVGLAALIVIYLLLFGTGGGYTVTASFANAAQLVEDQRSALLLVVLEGLSYREVAEVQGVPIGTVMSRLARARAQIKAYLDGERPPLRRVK